MQTSDALVIFGFLALSLVILPFGVAFYPFLILRAQLVGLARTDRRGHPTGLYTSGFWRGFLWCLLIFFCVSVPCAGQLFLLGGGLAGYIGWLIVWLQGRAHEKKLKSLNLIRPNLQFSMTDLFAAVMVYAVCMTVVLGLAADAGRDRDAIMVFFSGYLLMALGFGYYISLDALRRHAQAIEGRPRIMYILTVMLTAALFLPVAWLTWRSWRYALREVTLFPNGHPYAAPPPPAGPAQAPANPPAPPIQPSAPQTPPGPPPLPNAGA